MPMDLATSPPSSPKVGSGKYDNVTSKLYEPTTAYQSSKVPKVKAKENDENDIKSVKPIDSDSHLLAETSAYATQRTLKLQDRGDGESKKLPKPIEPESHLLRPTSSHINGSYISKDDEISKSSVSRSNAPVKISEHLLEPTKAMIHSKKALETKTDAKEEDPDADDIWWTTRGSPKQQILENASDPYADKVLSKLMEPTTAYVALKTPKYEKQNGTYESISLPKPIDPDSHVLTRTSSVRRASWLKEEEENEEKEFPTVSEARLLSMQTGPKNVESRLYETTVAAKHAVYKPKEHRVAEEEIKMEEEEAIRAGDRKFVHRTSERLLVPTAALEHSRYVKNYESNPREAGWKPAAGSMDFPPPTSPSVDETGSQSTTTIVMKVKEPSARLLEPTQGLENSRWRGSSSGYIQWTDREKNADIKLSEHLLEPTAANEHGKYQKQEDEVDPREVAWKPADPKPPKDFFELNEPVPEFLNPKIKVIGASEHLTTLTVANENAKWRGPPEVVLAATSLSGSQDDVSDTSSEKKKVLNVKPVSSTEHFLTPTFATLNHSVKGLGGGAVKEEEKTDKTVKKVKEPSPHLLVPTANNQANYWKNQPPKPTPEEIEEAESSKKVPSVKKVTSTEHFLTPTAATVNGQTKPVLKRAGSLTTGDKIGAGGKLSEENQRLNSSVVKTTANVSVKNLVKKFSSRSIDTSAE